MSKKINTSVSSRQEVNLKQLVNRIYEYKFFFIFSIAISLAVTFVYIKLAAPKYEVSTSLLIDPSGKNRALGESKYVEGSVSLIESEKNLYNELGIIKSFSLIRQTVEDLDFHISYHSKKWWKVREHYGYFLSHLYI